MQFPPEPNANLVMPQPSVSTPIPPSFYQATQGAPTSMPQPLITQSVSLPTANQGFVQPASTSINSDQ